MSTARRTACLLPVAIFLFVRAVTHATTPDPIWYSGLYDGANLDDILQGVSLTGLLPEQPRVVGPPQPLVGAPLPTLDPLVPPAPAFGPSQPRAPPLA